MQNILYRIQFQKLFIVVVCLSVLSAGFSPLAAQTRRAANIKKAPTQPAPTAPKTTSPASAENNFLASDSKTALSAAWTSGELPPPMALPGGNPDEIAATLARKVAAKSEESIPALLTALQLSGFFITDKNGQVSHAPTDGKGQGLAINGWEAASVAKMFGEGKTTTLKDLGERLKAIPYFRQRDVSPMLADAVRVNAENSRNPYLRMWARFIVELGKNSARKSDLTASAAKPEEIEIDAIQHLLLMRRLYGDLWSRTQLWKARIGTVGVQSPKSEVQSKKEVQFIGASYKSEEVSSREAGVNPKFPDFGLRTLDFGLNTIGTPEEQKKIPCRMDGNAPTVMDAGATISGEAYGKILELLEELYEDLPAEKAIQKFAMFQAAANIILAYAKFIQTYAALETKIVMEGAPPLIRTRNAKPGDRKPLRAEVRINIGNWQMYNCIRMVMNVTVGIDFSTLNDGPLGDVGVTWKLSEGGASDRYSNSMGINKNGEQIVGITQDGIKRIQDAGVGVRQIGDANYTKTDDKGIARVILEGTPQRNHKMGRAFEVAKQARVYTLIRMKAGEIKGDMVDAIGQALGGVAGTLTLPAELIYRTDWASTAALIVPVTDWEECERGWSGSISITRRNTKSWRQEGEKKGVRTTTASASTLRTYEYNGTINIKNALPLSSSGYNALNKVVATTNVDLKGESNATSTTVWESEKSSYYHDTCGQRMTKRVLYTKDRDELQGTGQGIADGSLFLDFTGGRYRFHITIPAMPGKMTRNNIRRPSGYCDAKSNQPQDSSSEWSEEIGRMTIEMDEGVLDPKNPDVIEGSRSYTESGGDEVEIRWSLRNCR
jgi:hypothetical protein